MALPRSKLCLAVLPTCCLTLRLEPQGASWLAGRDAEGGKGLAAAQLLPQQAAWLAWLNPLVSGSPARQPKAAGTLPEHAGVSLMLPAKAPGSCAQHRCWLLLHVGQLAPASLPTLWPAEVDFGVQELSL